MELFPTPSRIPASRTSPHTLPGVSPESTETLRESLKDNHERFHIFLDNEKGFHNHVAHHIIAIWAMGATSPLIEAAYQKAIRFQLPAISPPEQITEENFNDHLGKKNFYSAYVAFFKDVVAKKGMTYALEHYVFSERANVGKDGKHPEMLNRFFAGVLHPMIHAGYGYEFNLPGIAVEGLAQAAIHPSPACGLVSLSLFTTGLSSKFLNRLSLQSTKEGIHAFTILARILKDDTLIGNDLDPFTSVEKTAPKHMSVVLKHVDDWLGTGILDVEQKVEEIHWVVTMLYAIPGWKFGGTGTDFNSDFYIMHLSTSSIFLPSILAHLKPYSQRLFLRTHFAMVLTTWIARGRPSLDVAGFFAQPIPSLSEHLIGTTPEWARLTSASDLANPWLPIIQGAIQHPDDHVCKILRAFLHYASLYGSRKGPELGKCELEGTEQLDGTLFLRAATLAYERSLLKQQKEKTGNVFDLIPAWDSRGFFT